MVTGHITEIATPQSLTLAILWLIDIVFSLATLAGQLLSYDCQILLAAITLATMPPPDAPLMLLRFRRCAARAIVDTAIIGHAIHISWPLAANSYITCQLSLPHFHWYHYWILAATLRHMIAWYYWYSRYWPARQRRRPRHRISRHCIEQYIMSHIFIFNNILFSHYIDYLAGLSCHARWYIFIIE